MLRMEMKMDGPRLELLEQHTSGFVTERLKTADHLRAVRRHLHRPVTVEIAS